MTSGRAGGLTEVERLKAARSFGAAVLIIVIFPRLDLISLSPRLSGERAGVRGN
jgi:hypothetical protein